MMKFSTLIQIWYVKNRRNLPWRSSNDPYKIWLSEIILQQTRIDQGTSYYLKFIASYPTVKLLALASEDDILNNWQGLGYYSRARNLHATAKEIHYNQGGIFPKTYEEILKLKGIGEYTAAAISSIAYGQPYAVVDGNVYRVLSRFLNIDRPIDTSQGKKYFQKAANELLDKENPSVHNQALMEIGALVCAPRNPDCNNCPLNMQCMGYESGTYLNLPVKSKKVKVKNRFFNYLILQKGEEIMIHKRGPNDIWEGLYDFTLIESTERREPKVEELDELKVYNLRLDGEIQHVLSHQRIFASFWLCDVKGFASKEKAKIVHKNELELYPMPQLLIRYLESSINFSAD